MRSPKLRNVLRLHLFRRRILLQTAADAPFSVITVKVDDWQAQRWMAVARRTRARSLPAMGSEALAVNVLQNHQSLHGAPA